MPPLKQGIRDKDQVYVVSRNQAIMPPVPETSVHAQ